MDLSLARVMKGIQRGESGQILIGRRFLVDEDGAVSPFFQINQERL
jgi:hypothetical protein